MALDRSEEINWRFCFIHTIVFLLLYPIILIFMFIVIPFILIPLVIIRWTVDKVGHSKTDFVGLGEMVSTIDSLFLRDAIFSSPKGNCVMGLKVEGEMELSRLREIFSNKLLNVTSSDGSLKYPKFRQCLKQWCGYFFWNNVSNFDVEKHITLHPRSKDGRPCDDKIINELIQEMVNQPWIEGQPLWNVNLVDNYKPTKANEGQSYYSYILFRMHHINGDGYSLSCISKDLWTLQPESVLNTKNRRNTSLLEWTGKLLWNIVLPFRVAYCTIHIVATYLAYDSEWFIPQHRQTGKCWTHSTEPIPIKLIKDIKNHFGVSFGSVLWAVQTGVHLEVLKSRGKVIPEILPAAVSTLLPGHPGKMANNSSTNPINLPLGEEDPVMRLLKCHKEDKRSRSLIGAIFSMIWIKFCGLFPPKMIKWFMPSIFAFITSTVSFNDLEFYGDIDRNTNFIPTIIATHGLQSGSHGIFMSNVSYNGHVCFNIVVERALMGEKETLQLSSAVINQINILHQLTI